MTTEAYQQVQTAMVLDPEQAARIVAGDFGQHGDSLTPEECRRLRSQAEDAGMTLTRKLHQGWRLTKLLTLLPITFAVGDPSRLSDLVAEFWRAHQPEGLYFEPEALRFASLVAERTPPGSLLGDAARFEAAMLSVDDRTGRRLRVALHLSHDPRDWLSGDTGEEAGAAYDVEVARGVEQAEVRVTPCRGECRRDDR